jgi:hypothetical protein
MGTGTELATWMPYALASILAFMGTALDIIDRWKDRPPRTFLLQTVSFGLLNAAGGAILYNLGSHIDAVSGIHNEMLRALVIGVSYQVIIRSRLTTIGKQPVGVEWFYEKAKGLFEWWIRESVGNARLERLPELRKLSLDAAMTRFDDLLIASAALSTEEKVQLRAWAAGIYADPHPDEWKRDTLVRRIVDIEIPDAANSAK